jgi:DNA modification methylase
VPFFIAPPVPQDAKPMPDEGKLNNNQVSGPSKGEFVPPPDEDVLDQQAESLPVQEDFWRPPVRFGTVPVEKEPIGWDRHKKFFKLYPRVSLPFQVVERVSFGHPDLEPNRLFWGDNLHVMRQLPSESIDLIYIDPPFFSGRQYNVIFGDQNELRSFSDIWEGGMPGYLIWLNARLFELKRLLKKTGSICVHCDWHASHYIKAEMDKLFGPDNFRNEIVWHYKLGMKAKSQKFHSHHDVILWYRKTSSHVFNEIRIPLDKPIRRPKVKFISAEGRARQEHDENGNPLYHYSTDELIGSVWDILNIAPKSNERIGYPTQKPRALLERVLAAFTSEGNVVADFFCGGGTTAAVAQRLGRRWIACDQSRVAVAITADRISRLVEEEIGSIFPVPDFTIEHWGIYEANRLSKMPADQFREFVLRAFGATPDETQPGIHGNKGAIPLWVGEPSQRSQVTAKEVESFANAVRKTIRYQQDNLRDGIMLAWAFRPDAAQAAERLRELERTDLNFIRLEQIRIDSPRFREHIVSLSTEKADYANFLTFVQPPKAQVGYKRLGPRTYIFDVSETAVLNSGAKIINVQWDFSYDGRFSSTPGYSFIRGPKKEPALQAQYEFHQTGTFRIACKVQDDMGGEGMWSQEVAVE